MPNASTPIATAAPRGGPKGGVPSLQAPHRPKKHVIFLDEEEEMSSREDPLRGPQGQATGGGEVEESNLGPTPTLGPELEHFLEAPTTRWSARDRQGSLLEPSIDNYEMWLVWWAHKLDTPNW